MLKDGLSTGHQFDAGPAWKYRASVAGIFAAALLGYSQFAAAQAGDNRYQGQAGKSATIATQSAISAAISEFSGAGLFRLQLSDTGGSQEPRLASENYGKKVHGLAASADAESPWTLWFTPVVTQVSNRIAPITSKGSVGVMLLGLEHNSNDELIRGVVLAIDHANLDTTYNSGTLRGNGYTISPYLAKPLGETWLLDASLGFGRNNLQSNISGTTASPKDDRLLAAVGLTNTRTLSKNWMLLAKFGYSWARDEVGSYADSAGTSVATSTTTLGQAKAGAQMMYTGVAMKPFVAVNFFANDFSVAGGGTNKPREYSAVPQLQLGLSPSWGPWYASVVAQAERDRSAVRAYIGYRY